MRVSRIGVFIALGCAGAAFAGYSPNLRLSADLDALMQRLSCRSSVALPSSFYAQPMTAQDVARFLDAADSSGKLSPQEALHITQVRRHFAAAKYLRWQSRMRDASIVGHLGGYLDAAPRIADSATVRIRGLIHPSFAGNVGDFSYFGGIDVWTDYWSDTLFAGSSYQPYDGIPYNLYGRAEKSHTRSSDIVRGGIRFDAAWFSLETAIDYLRQGPAGRYPLTFSGYAPPLTYARARIDLGPAEYYHAFGLLKSQKDKPKYFYTHRLQAPLWNNRLVLGLTEVIVNGSTTDQQDSANSNALRRNYYGMERQWEWAYMIPFVPYKFAEHYLGDRDNGLISFDADLHFPRAFRWYAEFLIDDISAPWTLFSDDFGNKWAITAGWQWFGSLLSKDITATIEYSRVEPWVYTHFYGGSHRYDNFNVCLGNPLGPNSDAVAVILNMALTPRNTMRLSFVNERWNHSARGGNITDVWQDSMYVADGVTFFSAAPDSKRKTFLGRGTEQSTKISVGWKLNPLGICRVNIEAGYDLGTSNPGFFGRGWAGFEL